MSAAPRSHFLHALLIGALVSATGYAAVSAQPGGQGVQASDSNQKRDDRRQSGVVQGGRFVAPHHDFSTLRGATRNVAKPAIAARPGLSRRPDAEHPLSRRSVAGLKPLAAGNGVIGGPRAAGRGVLGGTLNGKGALKASIDGTALRRRF
jgi:hypothetical protein